jgi:hypothetical protein
MFSDTANLLCGVFLGSVIVKLKGSQVLWWKPCPSFPVPETELQYPQTYKNRFIPI